MNRWCATAQAEESPVDVRDFLRRPGFLDVESTVLSEESTADVTETVDVETVETVETPGFSGSTSDRYPAGISSEATCRADREALWNFLFVRSAGRWTA